MSEPKISLRPLGYPQALWEALSPFDRFAYHVGFTRCPDFRLHADWHRFEPETKPTRGGT